MKQRPMRNCGLAAVFASGVCAGFIESSRGRPSVTPARREIVGPGICCWVRSAMESLPIRLSCGEDFAGRGFLDFHLERRAGDDAAENGGELVAAGSRVTDDFADGGHVGRFEASAER